MDRLRAASTTGTEHHPPKAATTSGRAWASSYIPAVLDGKPARLDPVSEFKFRPVAFRALVPAPPEDEPAEASA